MKTAKPSSDQGDLLLWIAGGAIAAMGAGWLVITQPWKGGGDEQEITLAVADTSSAATRSEEHTSELQSPCNLVCRLLLEKKNFIAVGHDALLERGQEMHSHSQN